MTERTKKKLLRRVGKAFKKERAKQRKTKLGNDTKIE